MVFGKGNFECFRSDSYKSGVPQRYSSLGTSKIKVVVIEE